MLGHASAAMTLDTYADLFDDELDAVATALNADAFTDERTQPHMRSSFGNSPPCLAT
jgi:hypothetical protein